MIEKIEKSFSLAESHSELPKELLEMKGMSGRQTRKFINAICSFKGTRYLEIGSWTGSTACSALCNNSIEYTFVDNWSQFDGPKDIFIQNIEKYKKNSTGSIIEQDCWDIDPNTLLKSNVYLYDGNHGHHAQRKALTHFLPALDDEFIFMVDDWNLDRARWGTNKGIEENSLNVLYKHEILTTPDGSHPPPEKSGAKSDWHNGFAIFVLKK